MEGMMLHCGANLVDYDEVQKVPVPAPSGRHYPMAHTVLVDAARKHFETSGIEIVEESHALSHEGQRYFGLMKLKSGYMDNPDWSMVAGLRGSMDQTFAQSMVAGNTVFVCDNLCFSGEIKIARKNTRNALAEVPMLMSRAIGMIGDLYTSQAERYTAYQNTELLDREVRDALVRACESKVISSSKIMRVWEQWQNPEFEEHNQYGDSVWKLQQAFTEVQKGTNLFTLPKAQQALQGVLDPLADYVGRQFTINVDDLEDAEVEARGPFALA